LVSSNEIPHRDHWQMGFEDTKVEEDAQAGDSNLKEDANVEEV
jgi:hypothetical protein